MSRRQGRFTLPGEAGYEALTLEMAEKWGADVIRDSDGTVLSEDITKAGYDIYSTICIIRDHNEWAEKNTDKLQQTFLMTSPKVAFEDKIEIELLEAFFKEQFRINEKAEALKYMEVYDRTENRKLENNKWKFNAGRKSVEICGCSKFHKYTVSFLAYRIWEEISMYNHTTNNWQKEHLMQIDPRYEETREYLRNWLKNWCESHKDTTVVRFTSLFYNFVWIWGSSERNRHLFSDWASYDFTVSDKALDDFAEKYGYSLTAEDFINQGKLHVTHMPGNKRKSDWMDFIQEFVFEFGRELIDIVHSYGKKAYVFYDDSWVGLEPYGKRFKEYGFDGLIKCVFSAYEARLCAGADVPVHEIRLHPYLFPVGLGGAPTFMEGGNPALDAKKYWVNVRRGLLRAKIDRIGLGGYLHLVENQPEFCDYIEKISDEFRELEDLFEKGMPCSTGKKVAVLHWWGALRSWSLSGHFHETYMHDLIHVNEALAGLPVEVSFISFEDVKSGVFKNFDVIINAGYAGSAWSGGDAWKDIDVVEKLSEWVYNGGVFIGINEPSAAEGSDTYFRLAHILGVDEDTGARVCHGKWKYDVHNTELIPEGAYIEGRKEIYLTDGKAKVLWEKEGKPLLTVSGFGRGCGVYMPSFIYTAANTRLLFNLIRMDVQTLAVKKDKYITDNIFMECAYYPDSSVLVICNNSDTEQKTRILTEQGEICEKLAAYDTKFVDMSEKNRRV